MTELTEDEIEIVKSHDCGFGLFIEVYPTTAENAEQLKQQILQALLLEKRVRERINYLIKERDDFDSRGYFGASLHHNARIKELQQLSGTKA